MMSGVVGGRAIAMGGDDAHPVSNSIAAMLHIVLMARHHRNRGHNRMFLIMAAEHSTDHRADKALNARRAESTIR
jgi:hypothetical protein